MTSSTKKTAEKLRANVQKHRVRLKLTRLQLSIQADVSKDYIYDIEAGRRVPKLDVICRLADAFKIEPFELLK